MRKALKFIGFSLLTAVFVFGLYITTGTYGRFNYELGKAHGYGMGKAKCMRTSLSTDATERYEVWEIEES